MARKRMRRWCPIWVEALISNVSAAPATSGAAGDFERTLLQPYWLRYAAKNMPQNSNTMSSCIQAGREEDDDMAFRLLWSYCERIGKNIAMQFTALLSPVTKVATPSSTTKSKTKMAHMWIWVNIYFQPHLWCAKLFMDKYIFQN